ncbi:hypothetical protein OOK36_56045 [Streptomyces sp. NBC_00365]|uniref:hypothetical protein n=1 Tax=Streptomyces sp. NBC_00365 TaxID=2975726 RepID=UPI002255F3D2|nr:hypothetical protein [Streptomyces sp. NBC_00365]MCX5097768.1 hypothetical protein [Streptomyces sp. NBC_00365]
MVRNQRKKSRDKKRTATTGASRASAATGKVHLHEPLPDMTALGQLPYAPGRDLDTGLAARLVAACRAACQPCRTSLAEKIRTEHRPTLAALAGAVYGELAGRTPAASASPTTRSWAPLARAANTSQGNGSAALAAVEAMDDAAASDLLDDLLGHWAMGTPLPADLVDNLHTGAPRPSTAGATHSHGPDTGLMEGMLPYVPGWEINYDLAARAVSACWAGCESCQKGLTPTVVAHRATLAGLAGAAVLVRSPEVEQRLPFAGPAARAWIERAHGTAFTSRAEAALRAVAEMSEEDAEQLLRASLDIWVLSGAAIAETDRAILEGFTELTARHQPADPVDAFREVGVKVVTLDDLDLPEGIDTYHLAENYGIFPGQTRTPEGRPMPMITLYPETDGAGIEDLERRTEWEHWGLDGMPDTDPNWRLRARIADRSLAGLVHVGPDGADGIELWRAAESVSLPEDWWALLDQVQHVLVVGPVKEPDQQALQAAGDAGELLAVVARVEFH